MENRNKWISQYFHMSRFTYFWNVLAIVVILSTLFISTDVFWGFGAILSLMALACICDGIEEKYMLWTIITPLFWIIALIALIFFVIYNASNYIYEKLIEPFNEWLDKNE